MIAGKDIYDILGAIVPMYFVLFTAYISVRWLKVFTAEQCAGINRFLRVFAIPFLSFRVISSNNLYAINVKLFAADTLQKLVVLLSLILWNTFSKKSSLEWLITLFSLSSLPNTLIIGLPIARAMYGAEATGLMVQTLVFQSVIWINVLLILFEYRAVKIHVSERLSAVADGGPSLKGSADSPDGAVVKKSAGVSELSEVDLRRSADVNGLTQIFPENKAAAGNHVFPEKTSPAVSLDIDDEITSAANETFPAKQRHAGDDRSDTSSRGKATSMTKLVLHMVWKRFTRNPNTYSTLCGVVWSLVSFKYDIKIPKMVHSCMSMLADTGLTLGLFSLGSFMATQSNIIACSMWEAIIAMITRFFVSPAIIAATSKLVTLRGIAMHTAILQAAFPQALVSFIFAKEYNVHPNILSTSVAVGMLIAFPIILLYYLLLAAVL